MSAVMLERDAVMAAVRDLLRDALGGRCALGSRAR